MGPDNINISWNGEVYSKYGVCQICVVANLCCIKHSLHAFFSVVVTFTQISILYDGIIERQSRIFQFLARQMVHKIAMFVN